MVAAPTAQLLLSMALEGDPARVAELCQAVGIDPAVLTHPDGRLPRASVDHLAERLTALTGDPRLGFRALQRSHPSVFQVVGYAMLGCTSLLDAMSAWPAARGPWTTACAPAWCAKAAATACWWTARPRRHRRCCWTRAWLL